MRGIGIILVVLVLAAAAAGPASAVLPNLLKNGSFTYNLNEWSAQGAVVWDGYEGMPKGSAVVPKHAWALLTQTVRIPDSLWIEGGSGLQYGLAAKVKIWPIEDIHFKLGWWDDISTAPAAGAKPDHVIDLGNVTDTCWQWREVGFRGILDTQPRWLSVRIEWNPQLNPEADCHGWVDEVQFRAACTPVIPEPVTAALGCLGLAAVAGFRRLRK